MSEPRRSERIRRRSESFSSDLPEPVQETPKSVKVAAAKTEPKKPAPARKAKSEKAEEPPKPSST